MFVISQGHREQIEFARNKYLQVVYSWVKNALIASEKRMEQDIKTETDQEKPELYKLLLNLTASFLAEENPLFYEKILALRYNEMEDFWAHTFLESKDMKSIFRYFSKQPFLVAEKDEEDGSVLIRRFMDTGEYEKKYGKNSYYHLYCELIKYFQSVFPYKKLGERNARDKYNAYTLCEDLGIKICIYCNMNYTGTIFGSDEEEEITNKDTSRTGERSSLTRPDIDHFLIKSGFPIFQLTFDNLIPACTMCNSKIKHEKVILPSKYLHPYQLSEPIIDFFFRNREQIKIQVSNKNTEEQHKKIDRTMAFFRTRDIYGAYSSQFSSLWDKNEIYTPEYLDEILPLIDKKKKRTSEDFIKDLIGYVEAENSMNETFGEMRHQLTEQILEKFKLD